MNCEGCTAEGELRLSIQSGIVLGMAVENSEFTEHDLQGLKHFCSLRKLLT